MYDDHDTSNGSPDADWVSLADRAALFLQDHGGQAGEEELIAHVFGAGTNTAAWRPMLHRVLADPSRFRSLIEGTWSLVGMSSPASSLADLSFTVIDLEVSGRSPRRHQVIEVAAVRVRQGQLVDEFASLVNLQQRLPGYVTAATGITEEMLAEAPPFAAVARDCHRFIGTDLLVGIGLSTGLTLLRQQLILEGQPALLNQTFDLLALGDHIFPAERKRAPRHSGASAEGRNPGPLEGPRHSGESRNPGLGDPVFPTDRKRDLSTLAKRLGVQSGRRHRALPDAQTIAKVFLRLLATAGDQGLTTLTGLLDQSVGKESTDGGVACPSLTLNQSAVAALPEQPGVYVMKDVSGRVLYVGKSKSLRQRVASYFSQPLDYVRNLPGLLEAAVALDVHVVGSELEATLLEATLIRRLAPVLNIQRRYNDSLLYVKVDTAVPFPRLTTVQEIAPDGAKYFGPFRHSRAAKQAVRWVISLFPLRSCRRLMVDRRGRRKSSAACVLLGKGRCVGPCQGSVSAEAYGMLADEALGFLAGDKEGARRRLMAELQAARQRRDYTREGELRALLRQLGKGSIGELLLSSDIEAKNVAVVQPSCVPGAVEIFVLVCGRFAGQVRFGPGDPPAALAEWLALTLTLSQRERESAFSPGEGQARAPLFRRKPESRPSDHHAAASSSSNSSFRRKPESSELSPLLREEGWRELPLPLGEGWGEGQTAGANRASHLYSWSGSPAPVLGATPGPEETDAVNILTRWIYAHAGEPCIVMLPASFTEESLKQTAEALLDAAATVQSPTEDDG